MKTIPFLTTITILAVAIMATIINIADHKIARMRHELESLRNVEVEAHDDCQRIMMNERTQQRRNGCYDAMDRVCQERANKYYECKEDLMQYCERLTDE